MSVQTAPMDWDDNEYASFGLVPQVGRHGYHEREMFDPERIVALLDRYPRRRLQAFTMGEDPTRREDWSAVDIDPATSGEALWRAVENGRLWLNVTQIELHDEEYAALIAGMYAHLDEHCPHLGGPRPNFSTLLISSPGAQVYYHLDAEPNMLWHLRGRKRVWIYPAMDTRFVPQSYLEDIYAGEVDENLPYDPAFDQEAEEFLLSPGDIASWPHNGPHRIVNEDMNVSLATSYYTPNIYRRQYVQLANRFLLRGLGVKSRSMDEKGVVPSLKRFTFRVINKVRPFPRRNRSADYVTDLQIDPDAPLGLRRLDTPRHASFSAQAPSVAPPAVAAQATTASVAG